MSEGFKEGYWSGEVEPGKPVTTKYGETGTVHKFENREGDLYIDGEPADPDKVYEGEKVWYRLDARRTSAGNYYVGVIEVTDKKEVGSL